jgi:hypothetical protein
MEVRYYLFGRAFASSLHTSTSFVVGVKHAPKASRPAIASIQAQASPGEWMKQTQDRGV